MKFNTKNEFMDYLGVEEKKLEVKFDEEERKVEVRQEKGDWLQRNSQF